MTPKGPTVAVVGGGIAGLCAAVYARKCGYQVELFEKNPVAGGLATNWKKGEYTFENCLHWLVGSSPGGVAVEVGWVRHASCAPDHHHDRVFRQSWLTTSQSTKTKSPD
jgi:phytoene dehydrogenase-like protein